MRNHNGSDFAWSKWFYNFVGGNKTEVTRKQSIPNFPKNKQFLPPETPTYVCISGNKKCSFCRKFGELCFLVTSVLRIALLLYHRRLDWVSVRHFNLLKLSMSDKALTHLSPMFCFYTPFFWLFLRVYKRNAGLKWNKKTKCCKVW